MLMTLPVCAFAMKGGGLSTCPKVPTFQACTGAAKPSFLRLVRWLASWCSAIVFLNFRGFLDLKGCPIMTDQPIRFDDGAAYEQMMGVWSGLAGDIFLDWLDPERGLRWIDVGCGNGAFTERLVALRAPARIDGVDPSDGQLAYARSRHTAGLAHFSKAGAMELPFPAESFDAAVMALVIFFVPDPAKGVAEMCRVVRPGGSVSAYAWDLLQGGAPHQDIRAELETMGHPAPLPPSVDAARIENLHRLWAEAGLEAIATRTIEVQRTFADFEAYWRISLLGPGASQAVKTLTPDELAWLKEKLRSTITPDGTGRIICSARANAVKGTVPG